MKWLRRMLWVVKGGMMILCFAILVLWVRSYWRADFLDHYDIRVSDAGAALEERWIWSKEGWLYAQSDRRWRDGPRAVEAWLWFLRAGGHTAGWNTVSRSAGADLNGVAPNDGGWGPMRWSAMQEGGAFEAIKYRNLHIQHWFLALICGGWPITSLVFAARRARRRRRAARAGLCPHCGYDLRATPDGAGALLPRCPECGRERVESARPVEC